MEEKQENVQTTEARILEISAARAKSMSLLSDRLDALKGIEEQQSRFIENGFLSMLNQTTQKLRVTLKRIISADFMLQRKIHTRNIFLLRVRIRQMDCDLAEKKALLKTLQESQGEVAQLEEADAPHNVFEQHVAESVAV